MMSIYDNHKHSSFITQALYHVQNHLKIILGSISFTQITRRNGYYLLFKAKQSTVLIVTTTRQSAFAELALLHKKNQRREKEGTSLSPISSRERAAFILPSIQKSSLSFPRLRRPPKLPSPKMNLVGVSFPMFFTPQQFEQGKVTQGDPTRATHYPNMMCQNIVEDGSTDSNEVTAEKQESQNFPQETSKDINLSDLMQTKNKRKRRTYLKKAKICRMHECSSEAAKNTPYCKQHSGTRICEYKEGCTKCAQGRTRFCIGHGGGRRCTFSGCNKGARDHRFCAAHGGGRRCNEANCNKSAVGGTFKCSGHGGGRRCQMENCDKCAQSGTKFCVKHGGGKRCAIEGCSKVARGKSNLCMFHR